MVTGDSVSLTQDGRPNTPSKGIVAINTAGVWKPVCTEKWDDVSTFSLFTFSSNYLIQGEDPNTSIQMVKVCDH